MAVGSGLRGAGVGDVVRDYADPLCDWAVGEPHGAPSGQRIKVIGTAGFAGPDRNGDKCYPYTFSNCDPKCDCANAFADDNYHGDATQL